jgi:hypothetical protein
VAAALGDPRKGMFFHVSAPDGARMQSAARISEDAPSENHESLPILRALREPRKHEPARHATPPAQAGPPRDFDAAKRKLDGMKPEYKNFRHGSTAEHMRMRSEYNTAGIRYEQTKWELDKFTSENKAGLKAEAKAGPSAQASGPAEPARQHPAGPRPMPGDTSPTAHRMLARHDLRVSGRRVPEPTTRPPDPTPGSPRAGSPDSLYNPQAQHDLPVQDRYQGGALRVTNPDPKPAKWYNPMTWGKS